MSGQATGWVLRFGPHPDHVDRAGRKYGQRARGLRMVLLAVADASNRDGKHAHPGINNVADAALYSRSRVIEILSDLVAEGWLVVEQEGGGRGLATVYGIPGDVISRNVGLFPNVRAERDEHEKGSDLGPERVRSRRETVHSRSDPNGLYNGKNNGVAPAEAGAAAECPDGGRLFDPPVSAVDRTAETGKLSENTHRDAARRICHTVWEERDPRPAASWLGAVKVCERLLAAGHKEPAVLAAAMTVPTLTVAAMELELSKRKGPRRQQLKVDRGDSGSGAVTVGPDGKWSYAQ